MQFYMIRKLFLKINFLVIFVEIDIKHKLNDINPPPKNKLNACILVLVRKSDLDQLIKLIQNVDLVFNNKFNYPYVIFSDEDLKTDATFKYKIQEQTNSKIELAHIKKEFWSFSQSS